MGTVERVKTTPNGVQKRPEAFGETLFGDQAERIRYDPERQRAQLLSIRKARHAYLALQQNTQPTGQPITKPHETLEDLSKTVVIRYARVPKSIDPDLELEHLSAHELAGIIQTANRDLGDLVIENLALVIRIAGANSNTDNYHEAVTSGLIGLMQAAVTYDDPTFKFPFGRLWAPKRILGEIIDERRRVNYLPRGLRSQWITVSKATEELWQSNEREPTVKEISEKTGISLGRVYKILNGRHKSLDEMIHPNNPGLALKDVLSSGQTLEEDVVEKYQRREKLQLLVLGLSRLPTREKKLVVLHYGESKSFKEIALELEVSETRVAQLHQRALTRLREVFQVA